MLNERQSILQSLGSVTACVLFLVMQSFIVGEAKADELTDRETVVRELAESWATYSNESLESLLQTFRTATDEQLLEIEDANDIDKVRLILLGADSGDDTDLELGEIDKDFVYTPVKPCRVVDTRLTAAGRIPTEGTRSFSVHGSVSSQGGNPAGCPSPRGEPRAVHLNVVAVTPVGGGTIRAFPHGISPPKAALINYTTNTTIANAATVKTCYFCGPDITIQSRFSSAHVVIDVMGYYHEVDDLEDIAAVDWDFTDTFVNVGSTYVTLATKTVTIPVDGRIVILGEATFKNFGSSWLKCRFRENGSEIYHWLADAGDNDAYQDERMVSFYAKTATSGTKTYDMQCVRAGGTNVEAAWRGLVVQFFEADL